jgi:predicted Zn finger-like uncharacterized protein
MKVSCPACDSKYTIADEKVVGRKVKVRCKSCGGQILINGTIPPPPPDAEEGGTADAAATTEAAASKPATLAPAANEPTSSPTAASKSGPGHAKPEADDGITWSVNVSEDDERSLKTHEVVAGYLSGEFAGEVYVWHDGMTDWLAIPDVPQLAAAIEATQKKGSGQAAPGKLSSTGSHPTAAAEPAAPAKAKTLPTLGKAAKAQDAVLTSVQPEGAAKKSAARAAGGKRPQNAHDLFAASSSAGSETDVPVSEEDEAQKMTGARNENSVLFSLDALKAGITAAPVQTQAKAGPGKKAPATPRKKLEDLMAEPAAPLTAMGPAPSPLLLSANQSLLTAPAPPPPPKPKEPELVSVAPAAMTAEAMAFAKEKEKTKRMVIGLVAAIVLVGAVAGIAIAMTKKPAPAPVASAAPVPSAPVAVATPEPPKPVATEEPKAAESAAAAGSAAPAGQKATAVAQLGTKTGTGTAAKATDPKTDPKKEAKKEEPATPTSSGVASFNTAAASQALSVAAAQTSICKKPDGPTGQGKVQVTFAPSGRATTANIVSGPFGGTAVGGCVSGVFKRAKVPPFTGDPVTVSKSFSITP